MAYHISVCAPAYNNPIEVDRLLASLKAQTFQDFNIFISDDSDDDGVETVARRYISDFFSDRLHYVHNETKLGIVFNWNAAISPADGDYIKIMFSDDYLTEPTSLAAYAALLDDHPDASFAFSGSREVTLSDDPTNPVLSSYDRAATDDYAFRLSRDIYHLFYSNLVGAPSATIYRREPILHLFDEKSGFASDVFLYLDILRDNPRFAWTKEPLVSIGRHKNQYTATFTRNDERKYSDYRYMYEKYRLYERADCKEYFLNRYLIPFKKTGAEARACHIHPVTFRIAWIRYRLNAVRNHFFPSKNA